MKKEQNKANGKGFRIKYLVLSLIPIGIVAFLFLRPKKPIEERAYDVAVAWVERDLKNQNPTFFEYDSSYVEQKGTRYVVEVRVEMTNVYMMTKEYIYDVNVKVTDDNNCVVEYGMRRMEDEETEDAK